MMMNTAEGNIVDVFWQMSKVMKLAHAPKIFNITSLPGKGNNQDRYITLYNKSEVTKTSLRPTLTLMHSKYDSMYYSKQQPLLI